MEEVEELGVLEEKGRYYLRLCENCLSSTEMHKNELWKVGRGARKNINTV